MTKTMIKKSLRAYISTAHIIVPFFKQYNELNGEKQRHKPYVEGESKKLLLPTHFEGKTHTEKRQV